MKLLTLAIASYNMESFLGKCLDSISVPTIHEALEVIVINDGSKDRTSAIAHSYEQRYPQNIHIIDKENGNYGSCINAALEIATGKYFRPLDADDWMNYGELNSFVEKLQSTNADLVITGFTTYKRTGKEIVSIPDCVQKNFVYDSSSFDIEKNFCESLFAMHGMTYKTDVLRKNNVKLHSKIFYTDTEYILLPLAHSKSIIFYDYDLYQYNMMREGQSVQKSVQRFAIDSFFILSSSLVSMYIENRSQINSIVKSNQRCILRRVLYYFYVSALIFGSAYKESIREQMNSINMLIEQDKVLKNDVNKFCYKKIPFVCIWNKFHIRVFDYIPKAFL